MIKAYVGQLKCITNFLIIDIMKNDRINVTALVSLFVMFVFSPVYGNNESLQKVLKDL